MDATNAALEECTAVKNQCETNFAEQKSIAESLAQQLNAAMNLLKAEKEAREELTATILLIQQTSITVQEEVKKLQVENIQLQNQVQKLQAEQGEVVAFKI